MNIEEIEDLKKQVELLVKDDESSQQTIINQRQEIERLNNIINKAIEFIYKNAYDEEREICIDDLWGEIPKLLDILKGSEKE